MGKIVGEAMEDMENEAYYEEEADEWAAWEGMDDETIGKTEIDETAYFLRCMKWSVMSNILSLRWE